MSLDLTHIPCPAGDSCTAFQCIFGHSKARNIPGDANDATSIGGIDDGPPRKRARVDVDNGAASHHRERQQLPSSADLDTPDETTTEPDNHHKESLNVRPETATKPISPPPLKRQLPKRSHDIRQPAPSKTPQRNPGHNPTQQAKTKAEPLNPRLLKSSPASHEVRLKLLRLLHAEFKRLNAELKKAAKNNSSDDDVDLLLSDQQLITRALDEEQALALGKAAIYTNVMKNKVMQYKRMGLAQWKEERKKEAGSVRSKEQAADASEEVKIETGLTPAQEVHLLRRLVTPITDLSQHGYVPAIPTEASIKLAREGKEAGKGWEKCDRCQQRFQVFPGRRAEDGALTSGGSCRFHWGKPYVPQKRPGDSSHRTKRYRCCGEEVGESAGCFTRDHHVYKASDAKTLATVLNFAETPPNEHAPRDRAVAFDCEMGYTVHGMELIRLTAVSWPTGKELLDVLVRPLGEILDLNSRYSGIFPEDMARAKPWSAADDSTPSKSGTERSGSEDGEIRKKDIKIVSSPQAARDLLFSLISPSTPLIGHGLENDLNAVRIVHPTVVDTVLLYPHKGGLPYRYGLKMLMSYHLNRKIQEESGPEIVGHNSAEDARAAGDLVRLKVASEWGKMQRQGWKIVDGEFVPPGKAA